MQVYVPVTTTLAAPLVITTYGPPMSTLPLSPENPYR